MNALRRLRRLELDDGVCEALKWFAFAAMVVDHIGIVAFDRDAAVMNAVGRFAMPIFCLVFGYNLARPGADLGRAIRRLLWVGIPAQIFAIASINQGQLLPANILLTFAAGIGLVLLMERGRWLWSGALLLVAAVTVDYSLVGVGLLLASLWFWRERSVTSACFLFSAVGFLNVWNGNGWAWLGAGLVLLATRLQLDVPRWPRAFLVLYPVHLAVLGLLR